MSEYYLVIPKNAVNKSKKYLPHQFFNQQIVSTSMFGQDIHENNSLMFYKKKPSFQPNDFNKHFLVRISIDNDPDDQGLRRMSSEALHGGNIRINLDKEDTFVNSGVEDQLAIKVEAQIMPDGQEMRIVDIAAIQHKAGGKIKKVGKKHKIINKAAPNKKKVAVKKPKALHKVVGKKKVIVKKPKALLKTTGKKKVSVKKPKLLHKAVAKKKVGAKKPKVTHKAAGKKKVNVKKPKVTHKAK